jgi:hypothetical protein
LTAGWLAAAYPALTHSAARRELRILIMMNLPKWC